MYPRRIFLYVSYALPAFNSHAVNWLTENVADMVIGWILKPGGALYGTESAPDRFTVHHQLPLMIRRMHVNTVFRQKNTAKNFFKNSPHRSFRRADSARIDHISCKKIKIPDGNDPAIPRLPSGKRGSFRTRESPCRWQFQGSYGNIFSVRSIYRRSKIRSAR
jgi:hypothetical protein